MILKCRYRYPGNEHIYIHDKIFNLYFLIKRIEMFYGIRGL